MPDQDNDHMQYKFVNLNSNHNPRCKAAMQCSPKEPTSSLSTPFTLFSYASKTILPRPLPELNRIHCTTVYPGVPSLALQVRSPRISHCHL